MNADWFYADGDKRLGPVAEDELKRLVAEGRLRPGDLVWRDGMPDWVEARTVPALFPAPKVERVSVDDDGSSRRRDDDYDRPSRRGRDDYDDDRPSRRGRRRDVDDYEMDDDRPRVRRRDDDYDRYDDDYDRPRKKKNVKPGQVQAIAIMMLVGGILGLINALAIAAVSVCLWPGVYYAIVVCILLIIRASNMLGPDDKGPPRTLAILQIICIVNGDIPNLVLGIISIILLNDPTVSEYYRKRGLD